MALSAITTAAITRRRNSSSSISFLSAFTPTNLTLLLFLKTKTPRHSSSSTQTKLITTTTTTTMSTSSSSSSSQKITAPYGSWSSPITSDVVSGASKSLGGTAVDSLGQLFWLESRPTESGIMKHKERKFASTDVISSMPDNVITHIMDRLPLQEAVRTSILARNWRLKWTMLSQLIFDYDFFAYLIEKRDSDFGRIISRLIFHLKGAIEKVVFCIDDNCYSEFDVKYHDISHWILFLSRNGIKDLTIFKYGEPLVLPTHLFSCLDLKHLKLRGCFLDPPTTYNGFPNLLSLDLDLDLDHMVPMKRSAIGKLITQCPLHEILNIGSTSLLSSKVIVTSEDKMKEVDITNLTNLKILSLPLCHVNRLRDCDSIVKLLGFLSKLQELHLDFIHCQLKEGGPEKSSQTAFHSLKSLKLSRIDLSNGVMLSCAFELIKCFPNLATLEITALKSMADPTSTQPTPTVCSPEIDYNTTGILQFRRIVLRNLDVSENEVSLIKYLFACSPFLKKIVIQPNLSLASGEKYTFSRKLLKLHRASPVVDIDLR